MTIDKLLRMYTDESDFIDIYTKDKDPTSKILITDLDNKDLKVPITYKSIGFITKRKNRYIFVE